MAESENWFLRRFSMAIRSFSQLENEMKINFNEKWELCKISKRKCFSATPAQNEMNHKTNEKKERVWGM